jgi:hypothetical protein
VELAIRTAWRRWYSSGSTMTTASMNAASASRACGEQAAEFLVRRAVQRY